MLRCLTVFLLSAALVLGPAGARPAQALDEKELLGLLAGVAALAIIKKELDDRKDEKRAAAARVLPGDCVFRLEDRAGRIRDVLGPRCLQRSGVNLARLPDQCLREVRTTRGWRNAYARPCLERAGWQVTGRRDAGRDHDDAPRHGAPWDKRDHVLPGACRFTLEDRTGRLRDVVGPRCLDRHGVRLSRLPASCLREVRTTQGWRDAYGLHCLQREGWTLDGTRRIGN